jgi:GH15 family glucan-1,4-alpha-glucosidase
VSKRRRIEDYGLIGNLRGTALVARDGSIDWLAMPRFDSPAFLCALLGNDENGCWRIAPLDTIRRVRRRYLDETLVLETTIETDGGCVAIIDFMPLCDEHAQDLVRIVRGVRGSVAMTCDLRLRFDYGRDLPWVRPRDDCLVAIAGPDAVRVDASIGLDTDLNDVKQTFAVKEGQALPFVLTWYRSYEQSPPRRDADNLLEETINSWRTWCGRCEAPDERRDAVVRSAITLKALTDCRTGGIVAAATTSLPEFLGGQRNWDYRHCWLRDATFTLYALVKSGYYEEARGWREWLRRAVAGEPARLQVMYGVAGERRLDELELPWLDGFAGSQPVRIGNDAHRQLQMDIYGEVMDCFHTYRTHGLEKDEEVWRLELELMPFIDQHWQEPGAGIWERRGAPRRHVTSAVMCWVAADRAVKAVERFGFDGPLSHWRTLRSRIHDYVCRHGYDESQGAFVEAFGEESLDASVLLIPLVGFLPPDDARVVNTVKTIRRKLMDNGFVRRYDSAESDDGMPPGEGCFIACTLWMADALALMGRRREAQEIFERVLDVRNDLGLLAEEYDPIAGRQLGNFPQAFSHVGIINTAQNLSRRQGPAESRSERNAQES